MSGHSGTKLPDDIKSTILAEMCTGLLKEHLILTAANLEELRVRARGDPVLLGESPNAEPIAMDVDAFIKGGEGGKGSGKGGRTSKEDMC